MNKKELVINGIRAKKFKMKKILSFYYILNDTVVLRTYNFEYEPTIAIKAVIKSRHTKFEYPIGFPIYQGKINYQLLTNQNGRIYKMYGFKHSRDLLDQYTLTKCINEQ